jgi:ParB family chromosome partitioning protein
MTTKRITRGFNIDNDGNDTQPTPRRVRTRQQIMAGEGKRPPASVELRLLAHNPFNPRAELTEIDETAASLVERGQLQPVAVVRRAAFLAVLPEHEDVLGNAEYVVIDGNRRLAAATKAGLAELRIDVNDALAASAADLLESALIANVHRVDVPPLDQARAIRELVLVHGSQGKAAKRLGKTAAWVSQRLALLELTPPLQQKVEAGSLKVEAARRIGRLPKERQASAAEEAVKPAPGQGARRDRSDGQVGQTVNAVNTRGRVPGPGEVEGSTVNGVNGGAGREGAEVHSIVIPLTSPVEIVDALADQLPPEHLTAVAELLFARVSKGPPVPEPAGA